MSTTYWKVIIDVYLPNAYTLIYYTSNIDGLVRFGPIVYNSYPPTPDTGYAYAWIEHNAINVGSALPTDYPYYPNVQQGYPPDPTRTHSIVSIAASDASKPEGNQGITDYTFTVTLDRPATTREIVGWSLAGTGPFAASASDFSSSPLAQAVTFEAGETSKTITVNVVGDVEAEPGELFTVTLSSPSAGLTIGSPSATGTIANDDAVLSIKPAAGPAPLIVYEGSAAGRITITLSRPVDYDIDVRVFVSAAHAAQSDFRLILDTLRIPKGSDSFSISLVDALLDYEGEPTEQYDLIFTATAGGRSVSFSDPVLPVQIVDNILSPSPWSAAIDFTTAIRTLRGVITSSDILKLTAYADVANEVKKWTNIIGITIDATLIVSRYIGARSAANGDPVKLNSANRDLFVDIVDAVCAVAVQEGTALVLGGALSQPELWPILTTVIVGGSAPILYQTHISPGIKIMAASIWDNSFGIALPRQTVHGPVANATVFVDSNNDGLQAPDELSAASDSQGWFLLPFGPGSLVSRGGVDTATGLPIKVTLRAPEGSALISPLTTLASELAKEGQSSAYELVLHSVALELPTGLAAFDPVAAGLQGDDEAVARFAADSKVYAIAAIVGTALGEAVGVATEVASGAVISAMASRIGQLDPGARIDFDSAAEIRQITALAIAALGVGSPTPAQLDAIATVVAALGQAMTEALQRGDTTDALASLVEIQKLAEATVVDSVRDVIAGDLSPESFAHTYSAGNLAALVHPVPKVSIVAADANRSEGDSGTQTFIFTLKRTGDSAVSHSVAYSVSGIGVNPASAGDFAGNALPQGRVTFAIGETLQQIAVSVTGDVVKELDETFAVTLTSPSLGLTIGTASATGTIQDDEPLLPTVSIAALSPSKSEGSSGVTAFTFTVTLAGDTSVGHSVSWGVTGSGADQANGLDFAGGVLPSGMATFIVGETSTTVTVLVSGDAVVEPDEGFTVTLTAPSSGLSIGTGSAVAAIVNDDLSSARTTAHDDAYIVLQGTGLDEFSMSGVLANDDVVGSATAGASTVQLHGGTSFHGPLHIFLGGISPNGVFNYDTNGFVGVESFTYTVTSANGTTDQAKVSLYVVPVNAGPSTTLNLLALSAEEQIAATYAAFFGRAADAPGLAFWVGEFNRSLPTQGATALFANIASSFGVSAEAKALYPFLANPFGASDAQITAFLDSVYNNLFNRSSDAGGLGYWTGQVRQTLASGQFIGSVLVNIMSGAQDTESGRDITTLMGKVAVSLGFVHRQQELGTGLVGTIDVDNATLLLSSVTDDPTSVLRGLKEAATLAAVESLEGELDYGPNGLNTLVLPDRLDRYRLTSNGPSENGSNLSITNDDVDVTLSGISRVRFSDAYQAFDIDGHAGQLYRLYGAALGRVPDAAGFGWNLHLADAGTRLHDLAQFMMSTPEFGAAYGSNLTDDQFIVQLYQHTLGRLPDAATISDWQHRLISGTVDRADALLALSESEDHRREADEAINNGIGVDYSYFLGGQNFAGGGARDIHLSTGPDTVQFGLGEGDIVSTKLPVAGFEPFAEFAGAGYWGVPLSGQSARITASTSSTMTRLVGFEAGTEINHDALEFKVSSWHSINSGNVLTGGNGYSEIHAPVAPTTPAVAVGTIFHLATPNAVLPAPQEKPYLVVFDSIAEYADAAGLAEALESTAGAITFYGSGFRVPSAHLLFAYKSTTGNVRVADVDFIPPRVGPTELNSAAANFVVLASDMAELVGVTSLAMLAGENFKFVG